MYRQKKKELIVIDIALGKAICEMQDLSREVYKLEKKVTILPYYNPSKLNKAKKEIGPITLEQAKSILIGLPKEKIEAIIASLLT